MSKKKRPKKKKGRTTGRTSATVAIQSQTRPWRTEIHISEFGSVAASANCHHRTWFQRMRPKRRAPPDSSRMRSKPMSMMISNTTSVKSIEITESLLVPTLSTTRQEFAWCDHIERNYGCHVSQAGLKLSKLKNYPYATLISSYHQVNNRLSHDL